MAVDIDYSRLSAEDCPSKRAWAIAHGVRQSKSVRVDGLNFLDWRIERTVGCAMDHATYWNKNGKPYFVVSQPHRITGSEMKSIANYCDTFDLDVTAYIYPAWKWNVGVITLIWKKKE